MRVEPLLVDGQKVADALLAETAAERRRGLLGRDTVAGAMFFPGVRSVHTIAMRFAIDVAHINRNGQVLAVQTMRPWRLGRTVREAAGVLEAAAGAFAAWGVRPDVLIKVGSWPAS
jgi:uncharacterized protein